jgi:hypothetical protein
MRVYAGEAFCEQKASPRAPFQKTLANTVFWMDNVISGTGFYSAHFSNKTLTNAVHVPSVRNVRRKLIPAKAVRLKLISEKTLSCFIDTGF